VLVTVDLARKALAARPRCWPPSRRRRFESRLPVRTWGSRTLPGGRGAAEHPDVHEIEHVRVRAAVIEDDMAVHDVRRAGGPRFLVRRPNYPSPRSAVASSLPTRCFPPSSSSTWRGTWRAQWRWGNRGVAAALYAAAAACAVAVSTMDAAQGRLQKVNARLCSMPAPKATVSGSWSVLPRAPWRDLPWLVLEGERCDATRRDAGHVHHERDEGRIGGERLGQLQTSGRLEATASSAPRRVARRRDPCPAHPQRRRSAPPPPASSGGRRRRS
jgi:hypothetical protein